ncbi:MAG: polysaccharide deacetylase family protein, partial [Candidatus Marinimicrobia bacterium]|nr:polysaccharide deacetylase family protein [Candidatus Neomarinimicrobiota bacterium]
MKNKPLLILWLCLFIIVLVNAQSLEAQTQLLIRCDDIGMCHTVNMAAKKLIETGIPFSASIMVGCPWFEEAAALLQANPQISVGVHLTLNSEWAHYKWGPVSGREAVPSLVDEDGYFYASGELFKEADIKIKEVEKELRAQIEKALHSGLRIDYLDYHMGTAVSTPELRSLVEKLAEEYKLGIAVYFNEAYSTLWEIAPEKKLNRLLEIVSNLQPDRVNLTVIHLGMETPEMDALVDLNYPADPFRVSIHRQAELDALCSGAFEKALSNKG